MLKQKKRNAMVEKKIQKKQETCFFSFFKVSNEETYFYKPVTKLKMATVKTVKKWEQELNCELEKEVINNKVTTLKEEFFCGSLT